MPGAALRLEGGDAPGSRHRRHRRRLHSLHTRIRTVLNQHSGLVKRKVSLIKIVVKYYSTLLKHLLGII